MDQVELHSERTNLVSWLVGGVAAVAGIGLLLLANDWGWLVCHSGWQTLARELGSMLVISVAIGFLWELRAKRSLLTELLAKAKLAENVRSAGLVAITTDFQRGIEWAEELQKVTKLDVFFAYGRTWRATNNEDLRKLARKEDARIRVVLPDPDSPQLIAELARRFATTEEKTKVLIEEAAADFKKVFLEPSDVIAEFSLWYLPESPVFSLYRFDHKAVLVLYNHRKERGGIPAMVVEEGGSLYTFARDEFESMIQEGGVAKRVASKPKGRKA